MAFFSLHPDYEYFQGFNDIVAVLWLACQNDAETLYYADRLADRYFLNYLLPAKFPEELARGLSFVEAFASAQKGLSDRQCELLHVLGASELSSEGLCLVLDVVRARVARKRQNRVCLLGLGLPGPAAEQRRRSPGGSSALTRPWWTS